MTTRTLTQIVLKIWALMLLTRGVLAVPGFANYVMQKPSSTVDADVLFIARLSGLSTIVILTVLAVALFRYSAALSTWITPDDKDISIVIDARALMGVGLAVFGVTLMIDGVLELGPTLYAWLMMRNDPASQVSFMWERRWTSFARGGLEIVIGAAFFVGQNAIGRLWRQLRSQEA